MLKCLQNGYMWAKTWSACTGQHVQSRLFFFFLGFLAPPGLNAAESPIVRTMLMDSWTRRARARASAVQEHHQHSWDFILGRFEVNGENKTLKIPKTIPGRKNVIFHTGASAGLVRAQRPGQQVPPGPKSDWPLLASGKAWIHVFVWRDQKQEVSGYIF